MLNLLRKPLHATLKRFGMELRSIVIHEQADNPYHALSYLLLAQETHTILDAGASIGDTSQLLANLFPNANVHAIEPNPPFFEQLEDLARINPRIHAHRLALSNQDGTATLRINQSEGTNSLLSTSPHREDPYGDLLATTKETDVQTKTLDTFLDLNEIEQVDLLKLDLQGSELDAIQGASGALEKGIVRAILCEVLFAKSYENQPTPTALLHQLVEEHSFTLFNLYQPHYHRGRLLQADALLLHSSLLPLARERTSAAFHAHSHLPLTCTPNLTQ